MSVQAISTIVAEQMQRPAATLFNLADYLPANEVKKRLGRKRKSPAWNKKFNDETAVARLPKSWDRDEIIERIELLHSALGTAEEELQDAYERAAPGDDGERRLSNRFEKLAALVAELRCVWPAGDVYDPFGTKSGV